MTVPATPDPFRALHAATREHQRTHGCGAYTFGDGAGLAALSAEFLPGRILELGAALGYTACCLASGSPGAHVDTIERDPLHAELARRHIADAGLSDRITVHEGEFASVLPTLRGLYDMAFFDGFAPSPSVLNTLRELLTNGGVLVCANLGLTSPSEERRILSLLDASSDWRPHPSIEGGETLVRIKL